MLRQTEGMPELPDSVQGMNQGTYVMMYISVIAYATFSQGLIINSLFTAINDKQTGERIMTFQSHLADCWLAAISNKLDL